MDREIKAALLAFVGVALSLVWAAALFRFIVPSILEAHFYGSLLAGGTVGVVGVIGLVVLMYAFLRAVLRQLNANAAPKEAKQDDRHLGTP